MEFRNRLQRRDLFIIGLMVFVGAFVCLQGSLAQDADFIGTPRTGYATLTVKYTDLSTSPTPIISWEWYFPGGFPSAFNGQNPPPIEYHTPGAYDVSLTITTQEPENGEEQYADEMNQNTSDIELKVKYIVVLERGTDFGDAPDGDGYSYPTLLASNGARHTTSTDIFLGYFSDAENDGLPHVFAEGDDSDGTDDEEGVAIPPTLAQGYNQVPIAVIVHGTGYLHGWLDFNADGDWDDLGEQIFAGVLLSDGVHNLSVDVPIDATPGYTYARFRYCEESALGYDDDGMKGEVEDYMVEIVEKEWDFGDAPDDDTNHYPTLLVNNGARSVQSGFWFGELFDREYDGQPDPNAEGDDLLDSSDDEDGIIIPELVPGTVCTLSVSVSSSLDPLFNFWFKGWIDFTGDGDWDDPMDELWAPMAAVNVLKGMNQLTFVVPVDAEPSATYARFRIGTSTEISYSGQGGGEVEDYKVIIQEPQYDFGDAPDDDTHHYATLLANNGARHQKSFYIYLGSDVDTEGDGQPGIDATLDDSTGIDDEDGVEFLNTFRQGWNTNIRVTAHGTGYLYAWIDYNANGDWNDPGEFIITGVPLSDETRDFSIAIPVDAVVGHTYARFRFSEDTTLTYDGPGMPGEVEDYRVEILEVNWDFGDAPDDDTHHYATLLSNDGARHVVPTEFGLGLLTDREYDGQPDANAQGDDLNDTNDEDGVDIPNLIPGEIATMKVIVRNTIPGFNYWFKGWIDFNADGDWDDPEDELWALYPGGVTVPPGTNLMNFVVPEEAVVGPTYARFRISTAPDLEYYGAMGGGEVEDYLVQVVEPEYDFGDAPEPFFATTLANQGAVHPIDGWTYLGYAVDGESDGVPSTEATTDDTVGADDEDGVFVPILKPGHPATITVIAHKPGILHGWIDFDDDDIWEEGDEKVFNGVELTEGTHSLDIAVPEIADVGWTFARFRYCHDREIGPSGMGTPGEVEDYRVMVDEGDFDFGDAPSPDYPTYYHGGGAYHPISDEIYLGETVDAEGDGMPTTLADGDDADGLDDEDGVVIPTLYLNQPAVISLTAHGSGKLRVWIDINADGDWDDPGEAILGDTGMDITDGTYSLPIVVPPNTPTGSTYIRFRYSTDEELGPGGPGGYGEVEDYQIVVSSGTDVPEETDSRAIPSMFSLSQNFPNPFNPETTIEYQLPHQAQVTLTIYDIHGQEIRTLATGIKPAGYHSVTWDGRDTSGRQVATGVYLYRINARASTGSQRVFTDVKRMIFVK